jgi:hypothetical protein
MVLDLFRLRFFRSGAIAMRALPKVKFYYGIEINGAEEHPCDYGNKLPPLKEVVTLCGVRPSQLVDVCVSHLPDRSVQKVDQADDHADNKWNRERDIEKLDSLCGAVTTLPKIPMPSVLIE